MVPEMTAAELRDIFVSAAFKQDLEELSCYLASIAPERPVVHCLAKHLWKGKHTFQLEAKRKDLARGKVDLVVDDDVRVEFKSSYDFDMERLKLELKEYGDKSLKEMRASARNMKRSIGWNVGLMIYEDICEKKPDIFVWIICSRNLSMVDPDLRKRICMSKEQLVWNNRGHSYPDSSYIPIADSFLRRLKAEIIAEGYTVRPFSVLEAEIKTNGDIPSTYHFRICDLVSSTSHMSSSSEGSPP